jgi:hypothetical protein
MQMVSSDATAQDFKILIPCPQSVNLEALIVSSERYHRAFIPVMKLLVAIAGKAGDRGYKVGLPASSRPELADVRFSFDQAASRFARGQSEVLLPFFREDELTSSLLGLEALETIVRFLFVLADDERKLVKVGLQGVLHRFFLLNKITYPYRTRNRCWRDTRRCCVRRLSGSWQETI